MNVSKAFATVVFVVLMGATSLPRVFGQTEAKADLQLADGGEESRSPLSDTAVDQSPDAGNCDSGCLPSFCFPRWTVSADFVILDRLGSVPPYTLVETVSHSKPMKELSATPGSEVLNATDLHQGFAGGPKLGLVRHGDDGYDLELTYFQINGWNDYQGIGPTPDYWLIMRAPGGFLQTQDNQQEQMMVWDYSSRLYNAEVNLRWNPCARITVLAGFRWINLSEELQGTLPPERAAPFWDTQTKNNLYGFQIGAEGKLLERGRFSIDCMGKAGIFDNHTEETTTVSIYRIMYGESAWTNHAAFAGETGLKCKFQFTRRLALKAGYEALWLQGVSIAPAQIPATYCNISLVPQEVYVQALGINCSSGVFYHGAAVGLEYAF
jgi:hypothetical protein